MDGKLCENHKIRYNESNEKFLSKIIKFATSSRDFLRFDGGVFAGD